MHWALYGSELTLVKKDISSVKLIYDESLANQLRAKYKLQFIPTCVDKDQIQELITKQYIKDSCRKRQPLAESDVSKDKQPLAESDVREDSCR